MSLTRSDIAEGGLSYGDWLETLTDADLLAEVEKRLEQWFDAPWWYRQGGMQEQRYVIGGSVCSKRGLNAEWLELRKKIKDTKSCNVVSNRFNSEAQMSFKTKAESGGNFGDIPPAGNHPAVLVALIDLGTQEVEYKGVKDWKRKVYMAWELVTEKMSGTKGANHVIARDFTFSFTPKSMLRGFVEKWRGKSFSEGEEFDLSVLVGKPCLLTVIQKTSANDNAYAKVEGVSAVPKGMKVDKPQRTPFQWGIEEEKLPEADWLPYLYGNKIADVIMESSEKSGKSAPKEEQHLPAGVGVGSDDEAPF